MSLEKNDLPDRIVYQIDSVTLTLWKDDVNLRFELITPYPLPGYANWQEYAEGIEQGASS